MQEHDEQNDQAWDLLEKASPVKVDPFFSRNVVRAVRQLDVPEDVGFWSRLFGTAHGRLAVGAGCAALCVAAFLALPSLRPGSSLDTSVASGLEATPSVMEDEVFFAEHTANTEPAEILGSEIAGLGRLEELLDSEDVDTLADADLELLFVGL